MCDVGDRDRDCFNCGATASDKETGSRKSSQKGSNQLREKMAALPDSTFEGKSTVAINLKNEMSYKARPTVASPFPQANGAASDDPRIMIRMPFDSVSIPRPSKTIILSP